MLTTDEIKELPICEFVTPAEAAKLLGVSTNSIGKFANVKKKVYAYKIAGTTLYHKLSVIAYRDTGDGRL